MAAGPRRLTRTPGSVAGRPIPVAVIGQLCRCRRNTLGKSRVKFKRSQQFGQRTGRVADWTPQTGMVTGIGVVFLVFAVFSVLRGTVFNNLWWVFTVTVFSTVTTTVYSPAVVNVWDGSS